jgi:hypothetical protein
MILIFHINIWIDPINFAFHYDMVKTHYGLLIIIDIIFLLENLLSLFTSYKIESASLKLYEKNLLLILKYRINFKFII